MEQHPKQSKPVKHSRFPSTSVQDSSFKIPILPAELITEILLRLPVESLLRFRCVSKSSLALISSPEFVKAHLNISANNKDYTHHRFMMHFDTKYNIKDCALSSLFNDSVIETFDLDYPTKSNGSDKRFANSDCIVGSFNGLICLAMEDNGLVIWNPSIRKYKKLPDSRPKLKKMSLNWHRYGFGYDEFHDDYKVVGIFTRRILDQVEVKIYSLKSDSWTSVINCLSGEILTVSGKFVNGKLHWAIMAPGPNGFMIGYIISFDLADEKWEKVELPCYGEEEIVLFWLELLGSDLSIICDLYRTIFIDVWVMKEYWVTESWTKMFVIKRPDDRVDYPCYPPFFMSNEGEILVVFGLTFMIYNPKDEKFKSLDVINSDYWRGAEIYVKSLVCPFSTEGTEHATTIKVEKPRSRQLSNK